MSSKLTWLAAALVLAGCTATINNPNVTANVPTTVADDTANPNRDTTPVRPPAGGPPSMGSGPVGPGPGSMSSADGPQGNQAGPMSSNPVQGSQPSQQQGINSGSATGGGSTGGNGSTVAPPPPQNGGSAGNAGSMQLPPAGGSPTRQ